MLLGFQYECRRVAKCRTYLDNTSEIRKRSTSIDLWYFLPVPFSRSLESDEELWVGIGVLNERIERRQGIRSFYIEAWQPFLSKGFGIGHESPPIRADET